MTASEHLGQCLLAVATSHSGLGAQPFLWSLDKWTLKFEIVERTFPQPGMWQMREVKLTEDSGLETWGRGRIDSGPTSFESELGEGEGLLEQHEEHFL